jgi:hypothetical protein
MAWLVGVLVISGVLSAAIDETTVKADAGTQGASTSPSANSVVSVNPQSAVRGSIVTVTLTNPPKDAKSVEVALDGQRVPVPNPDPGGNYRLQIPVTDKPADPLYIPLGKHRVSVVVDNQWFTGSELLDVERPEPAPKLVSISPLFLVSGSSSRNLTLTGENFNVSTPADNKILFDNSALNVVWNGCNPKTWKPGEEHATHGSVGDGGSTIELCNVSLPEKSDIEVNVAEGINSTASGLHLTISRWSHGWVILWSFVVLLVCAGVVLLLALFARKYCIGDTQYGMWTILFLDLETDTYSLSKLQFYLWTGAAILTYTYLVLGRLFVQGLDLPDVPSSLPGIIAIGAGTAIGSQFVTNVRGPKGGGPEKPSLADFVTSGGVAAADRVQMLVWTLVGVVGFCAATFRLEPWSISTLPKIGDSLMLLMGISSAGYLGGKLARKPGPVLNEISFSPSGPDMTTVAAAQEPEAGMLSIRTIELRGRNLSSDATFEINRVELPLRMLVRNSEGVGAPEIVATEDDSGATNLARALRLTIDPNTLEPSDRKTYDAWFLNGGKDLKFAISNPDGQMSEMTATLPPGTQQART